VKVRLILKFIIIPNNIKVKLVGATTLSIVAPSKMTIITVARIIMEGMTYWEE
jgi:hypothetical protein